MAAWAWPNVPDSRWARILLRGGPFDGEDAGYVPPDTTAPVQVVWSHWGPCGFEAWLYEWTGETTGGERGRTEALVFRPTGRRIPPADIPPVIAESADLWADTAMTIQQVYDVPAELLWPGL